MGHASVTVRLGFHGHLPVAASKTRKLRPTGLPAAAALTMVPFDRATPDSLEVTDQRPEEER